MREIVLKQVLKNTIEFGKPNAKVILGLFLKDKEELKKKVPAVMEEITSVIKETEKLSIEQMKEKLKKLAPELLKEKKEEKEKTALKPLPKAVKNKFVVRIAPSPSGPLHIGHAYGVSINYLYAKMYGGKLLLRIEDPNPENIYPPAYQLIEEDVKWLTKNDLAETVIQSARLGIYYDYAETLVRSEKAYVCTCNPDEWRLLKSKSTACPCRNLSLKEQQTRYAKMFNEYSEGEAVLRMKTDLKHKNPAMRDFSIMRINEHVHPKTGKEQRVWPLMIFSVAIDDHELGITHVLNGKDHADNAVKQQLIMKYLGWKPPEYKHWGRINFIGFDLSTSKTRLAIEHEEYTGWDDMRIPFLQSLKKRGYQPEAFWKYAEEIGLSLTDKKVSIEEFWKNINSFNREIVESKADRYFFIDEPVGIKIIGAPKKKVEIALHPNFPKRGNRILEANAEVYLADNDIKRLTEGKIHRLMDYCNFQMKKNKYEFVSEDYEDYKNAKNKGIIMHWIPVQKGLPRINVLSADNIIITGYGEEAMNCLKEGQIVQLERRY